jgi:hypothetical protein
VRGDQRPFGYSIPPEQYLLSRLDEFGGNRLSRSSQYAPSPLLQRCVRANLVPAGYQSPSPELLLSATTTFGLDRPLVEESMDESGTALSGRKGRDEQVEVLKDALQGTNSSGPVRQTCLDAAQRTAIPVGPTGTRSGRRIGRYLSGVLGGSPRNGVGTHPSPYEPKSAQPTGSLCSTWWSIDCVPPLVRWLEPTRVTSHTPNHILLLGCWQSRG